MSLENLLQNLIVAIEANTVALQGVNAEEKPKTGKKGRGKGKKKDDSGTKPAEKITAADVKKLAGEIAKATDDPKDCMEQIRALVTEVAEDRFSDGNLSLNDFDGPALYIFEEKLKAFVYGAEDSEEATDGLEI